MLELIEMVRTPPHHRFPGGYGAHVAVYNRLQCTEDRILPAGYDWSDPDTLDRAIKTMTAALRPWTIDFHVAQNDATVQGSGSHDKQGATACRTIQRQMDIVRVAGAWMRDRQGSRCGASRTSAGTGCMFLERHDDESADVADVLAA